MLVVPPAACKAMLMQIVELYVAAPGLLAALFRMVSCSLPLSHCNAGRDSCVALLVMLAQTQQRHVTAPCQDKTELCIPVSPERICQIQKAQAHAVCQHATTVRRQATGATWTGESSSRTLVNALAEVLDKQQQDLVRCCSCCC